VVIYLNSHPGIGNDPREKYSEQFESFVLTFSELLRTLNEFRSSFREQAISKVIQDGHRADVLAKQKLEQAQRDELAKQERLKQEEAERQAKAKRDKEAKLHEEARREEARRQELAMQDEVKRQELAKRQENERKEQAKKEELERAKKNTPSFIVLQEGHPLWSPSGTRIKGSPPSSIRGPIVHTPPPVEPKR
jgi:septal ring factor EnvC (AmiA/AmiB activator)